MPFKCETCGWPIIEHRVGSCWVFNLLPNGHEGLVFRGRCVLPRLTILVSETIVGRSPDEGGIL